MVVSNPPTDFFRALTLLTRDWDERVRTLSVQSSALNPGGGMGGSGEPAELAEDMLEAVQGLAQRGPELQSRLRHYSQDLAGFLDATRHQWRDLLQEVAQYEQWAGQYGYTPQLPWPDTSTQTWDQILAVGQPAASLASAAPDSPLASEVQTAEEEEEEESAPPTIFESGVSQGALQALGYTFKEQIPTSSPAEPVVSPPAASTRPSVALTSDEEDSGPLPIMKKPAPLVATPDPLSRPCDQSRVEITPGLFVRKPKTKSAEPPDPPSRPSGPLSGVPPGGRPIEDALTPQRPQLTVDIQRILAQARLTESGVPVPARARPVDDVDAPQYPTPKSPYGQRWSRMRDPENVQPASLPDPDDLTPEMPHLSSQTGQSWGAPSSAQKPPTRARVMEAGSPGAAMNPDLTRSPGPPQRPQLHSEVLGQIRDRVW